MLSGPSNVCDFDIMAPLLRSDNFIMECVPDHPANIVFKNKNPNPDLDSCGHIYNFLGQSSFKRDYLSPLIFKKFYTAVPFLCALYPSHLFLPFHRNVEMLQVPIFYFKAKVTSYYQ